jgi:hypothetical protein
MKPLQTHVSTATQAHPTSRTHLVPLDLIQLAHILLSILLAREKIVQMRTPFFGRDDFAREFLDVRLDVRPEDLQAAELTFNVE